MEKQIQEVSDREMAYAVSPFLIPIFRRIGFRCQVSGVRGCKYWTMKTKSSQ